MNPFAHVDARDRGIECGGVEFYPTDTPALTPANPSDPAPLVSR